MKTSSTAFWRIVYECMTTLLSVPDAEARMRIRELRRRLQAAPSGLRSDMIYHMEPYDLAQSLAGGEAQPLTPEKRELYDAVVERCAADAAVMGTDEEVLELAMA